MMNSFYLKNTRSMLFSMLLSLLMCVVGASKASAGNVVPRNPIVRIDNGPTYSDNGTEVTLKLWMYNYDGDNAWFIGDVYLTIDGVKVCKLNDMWNKIANVSNEKDIKNYQNGGNVGSQGTIMLDNVKIGTAQFCNVKKNQTCAYNKNYKEDKWTTVDLKLSFNNSFAYILHKINVEGKWRDRCDNKNMADKNWNIENTINGYVYPSDFKIERRGWNFELSWIKQKHNTYVKSDGKWVLYKHLDDTSVKVAEIQSTANIRYIEIPLKDFSCNATYYITFVPSTFTEAETICGLTTSASKGGHSIIDDGLCKNCEHYFLQYQTTDGKIVSFDGNKDFGANILSHTVDKTGNCVIEFDGSITTIPDFAFHRKNLCNSISIPSTVKSIGKFAFYNCKLSGKLTIPNSVTKIGSSAFSGCSGLTGDLTIPNSVAEIDGSAFSGCSGFNGKLTLSDKLVKINTFAFSNCSGLKGALTIPNSVTEIDVNAFSNCSGFNGKLTLSNKLVKIGAYAFRNCSGLTGALTIPNSVTEIGESAFYNCSGFNGKLTLSDKLVKIGASAFNGCSGFTGALTIPNSVNEIDVTAFLGCSGFNGKLTLSDKLVKIGASAFKDCSGLTGNLTIPNSVTEIGPSAFCKCSGFTGALTIPNSVTEIGLNTFFGCSGFNGKLTLSDKLVKIGASAFNGCSGFTGALTIPNSVTEIGGSAFWGCSGFNGKLTLSNKLAKIGSYTFDYCKGFTGDLIIPNSVTEIAEVAFRDCTGFNGKLILSNNLKKLGNNAFNGIKISANKQVVLPATLEEIEESAFANSNIQSLKFLSLPKGLNNIQVFSNTPQYVSLSDASYISELTDGNVKEASYSRTMSNTWGTLVLPYNLKLTGEEPYSLYAIDHIASDEIVLRSLEGEVTAGTPCIVKRKGEQTELTFVAENASINVATNTNEVGDLNFMGTYWAKELTNGYIIRKDNFWNVAKLKESSPNTKALRVGPFRSWLEGAAPNGAAQLSLRIDNPTTSIDNVAPLETLNADNVEYYDLNGKRLAAPMKGVNIVKRGNKTMKVIIK